MKLSMITGLNEVAEEVPSITMDMPLFIRALEYAKEDAKTDIDLHFFAEHAEELMKSKKVLTMDDYAKLISGKKEDKNAD